MKSFGKCLAYSNYSNIGAHCFRFYSLLHFFFIIPLSGLRTLDSTFSDCNYNSFLFLFSFIFKLHIIVLVLPNIKMNPPQIYMCSPSWTLLPPHTIPLRRPSALAPSIQYRASNLDCHLVSYMIFYMFQCHSPKSSHFSFFLKVCLLDLSIPDTFNEFPTVFKHLSISFSINIFILCFQSYVRWNFWLLFL